jgi:hypothetical protein
VSGQQFFERGERIRCDIKSTHLHIFKEQVEIWRVEINFGQSFVTEAFSQDQAAVQSNIRVFVSVMNPIFLSIV